MTLNEKHTYSGKAEPGETRDHKKIAADFLRHVQLIYVIPKTSNRYMCEIGKIFYIASV